MVAPRAHQAQAATADLARAAMVDQDLVMGLWPQLAATAANSNHPDTVPQLPHKEATAANKAMATRVVQATKSFTCQ